MLNKNVINVQSKIESKNDTKTKQLDKISSAINIVEPLQQVAVKWLTLYSM